MRRCLFLSVAGNAHSDKVPRRVVQTEAVRSAVMRVQPDAIRRLVVDFRQATVRALSALSVDHLRSSYPPRRTATRQRPTAPVGMVRSADLAPMVSTGTGRAAIVAGGHPGRGFLKQRPAMIASDSDPFGLGIVRTAMPSEPARTSAETPVCFHEVSGDGERGAALHAGKRDRLSAHLRTSNPVLPWPGTFIASPGFFMPNYTSGGLA
jgi:hypothetical protein